MKALEGIAVTCVGILLAQAPNDKDKSKAVAILDFIRQSVIGRLDVTNSRDCEAETREALDDLLRAVSEHLDLLRPR